MENIETGLLLIAVGMTTVFAILLIVINLGKCLITLVNKYAPEEVMASKRGTTTTQATTGELSHQETAAIISAVSTITLGLGRVSKIEKI